MFISSVEYYNHETQDKGLGEVIISKRPNGLVDTVKLTFLQRYVRLNIAAFDAFVGEF